MKTTTGIIVLIIAITATISCKDNPQGNPSDHYEHESTGTDSSDLNIPNHIDEDNTANDTANKLPAPGKIDSTHISGEINENFVNEAAGGGMMEVMLGQLAQQNAANPRVKAFGAMMVADHSRANHELKLIAGAKNHALPTALSGKHQKQVTDLSKKQGDDFDLLYIKMMIDDHEQQIKAFERATENVSDTTVKAFARRTLPALRKHLDSARAVYRGLHGR
jgi:putative membrane protein